MNVFCQKIVYTSILLHSVWHSGRFRAPVFVASRVNNTSELYLCGRSERISKSLPFHGCIYMNVCEQHMVDMGKL